MSILTASFALAGVGLALTHYVLQSADPSPRRWTPMDLLIQAAGLGVLLLAVALEIRCRRLPVPGREQETALRRALHAEVARLDTYREGSR